MTAIVMLPSCFYDHTAAACNSSVPWWEIAVPIAGVVLLIVVLWARAKP